MDCDVKLDIELELDFTSFTASEGKSWLVTTKLVSEGDIINFE